MPLAVGFGIGLQYQTGAGAIDYGTTVDVELLDANGLVLLDADGKVLLAANQVFGLVGGLWLQLSDGTIFGVSPA
jgi:hypothetical protein